jgi:hypothetical protein
MTLRFAVAALALSLVCTGDARPQADDPKGGKKGFGEQVKKAKEEAKKKRNKGQPGPNMGGPGNIPPGPFGPLGPKFDPRKFDPSKWEPPISQKSFVAHFDRDGDGRLNKVERKAAMAAHKEQEKRFGHDKSGGLVHPDTPPAVLAAMKRAEEKGKEKSKRGKALAPENVKPAGDGDLYDLDTFRTFFLEVDSDDWDEELRVFRMSDVVIPATLTVDGRKYKDVGLHSRDVDHARHVQPTFKRPFCISFDDLDPKQRFIGRRSLRLLNANGDVTAMGPVLYSAIAGPFAPTPKANFVRVVVNGESWGVYLNVEPIDETFWETRFKAPPKYVFNAYNARMRSGLEDLGDEPGLFRRAYALQGRDDLKAWPKLIELVKRLNQGPLNGLEDRLKPILDVDGALRMLAVETVLVNYDGYGFTGSLALFCDDEGVFHVAPRRIDRAFRAPPGTKTPTPAEKQALAQFVPPQLDPLHSAADETKPLYRRLLAVPALRERYLQYVREIADKALDPKAFPALVLKCRDLIQRELDADTKKLSSMDDFKWATGTGKAKLRSDPFGGQIVPLVTFAEQRRNHLLELIPAPAGAN